MCEFHVDVSVPAESERSRIVSVKIGLVRIFL